MNKAEPFLVGRRLWRFRFVHLLIALLTAATLMAVMIHRGYLVSLTGQFGGQLVQPTLPADTLVRVSSGVTPPVVTDARLQLQLDCWQVVTPAGKAEMAGVASSLLSDWRQPAPGEVLLPLSLRDQTYHQAVGDQITLVWLGGQGWRRVQATVAGYYPDGGFVSPLLVDPAWAVEWVGANPTSRWLAYPELANKQLERWSSLNPGAELTTANSIARDADNLVASLYSGGSAVVLLGSAFLGLGFGILALLVFLDSRTELAVLKATGLRPVEVGRLFWVEFGCSSAAGLLLGLLALTWVRDRLAELLTLNPTVFRSGLVVVVGSFGLAMLAPTRLATRAKVNELLLRRPILLWSRVISSPERPSPGLEDLQRHGWSCIRLERDDSAFRGVVLRPAGSKVKQGETLAWQSTWFGLGEQQYLAPHDGLLQLVDIERGVLAISAWEA